jgi:hypothetical protein
MLPLWTILYHHHLPKNTKRMKGMCAQFVWANLLMGIWSRECLLAMWAFLVVFAFKLLKNDYVDNLSTFSILTALIHGLFVLCQLFYF